MPFNADETHRRGMIADINGSPLQDVITDDEPTWTTDELTRDFVVQSFLAPYVLVTRRSDGVKGTLLFRHSPRVYFNFRPD